MVSYLLGTLFIIICVLLIVVVLLQKGRGGGLGAAFGGAGSSAFGTRIGDVFTWVTIVLTALFLLLAVGTTLYFRPAPDQVSRPMFFPAPTESKPGQPDPIHIECRTGAAEIHYTIDGSEPTKESTRYESPVAIKPNTTIKARAYRGGGWTPSPVVEAFYGEGPTSLPAEATTSPATATATAPAVTTTAPAAR